MGVGWPYEAVVVDRSTDQLVGGTQFNLTYLPCSVFAPPKVPALPMGPPAEALPPVATFRTALPNAVIPPTYYGKPWGVMFQGTSWWVVPFYQKNYSPYYGFESTSNSLALFDNHRLVWVLPVAWMLKETDGMGLIKVISAGARGHRLFVQFHANTVANSDWLVHVVDLTYQPPNPDPTVSVEAQYWH
jgi:hypothetical protein